MDASYTTVGGYLTDGAIVCKDCGDEAQLSAEEQVLQYRLDEDFSGEGLYCDNCRKEIVAPPDKETELEDEDLGDYELDEFEE